MDHQPVHWTVKFFKVGQETKLPTRITVIADQPLSSEDIAARYRLKYAFLIWYAMANEGIWVDKVIQSPLCLARVQISFLERGEPELIGPLLKSIANINKAYGLEELTDPGLSEVCSVIECEDTEVQDSFLLLLNLEKTETWKTPGLLTI